MITAREQNLYYFYQRVTMEGNYASCNKIKKGEKSYEKTK